MRCVELFAAALLTAILSLQGCNTSEQTLRRLAIQRAAQVPGTNKIRPLSTWKFEDILRGAEQLSKMQSDKVNYRTTKLPANNVFTSKAINVIMVAQTKSTHPRLNFVDTEQIFSALRGERFGVTAKLLKSMTVDLETAVKNLEDPEAKKKRVNLINAANNFKDAPKKPKDVKEKVNKLVGQGPKILFTRDAERVLELSFNEARRCGDTKIGPEHILVGLLELIHERDRKAAGVDTNLLKVRKILQMRCSGGGVFAMQGYGNHGGREGGYFDKRDKNA